MPPFGYISEAALEDLWEYRYMSAPFTPLENLMDPLVSAFEKRCPRWVSPNMMSLMGGSCNTISAGCCALAVWLDVQSLFLIAALLMFFYVILDSADGKHARNTKQATPLGAIVDHGVDAFQTLPCAVIVVCFVDGSISTPWTVLGMATLCIYAAAWFAAQWVELETGVSDVRGIVEAEFALVLGMLIVGVFGIDFFSTVVVVPLMGPYHLHRLSYSFILAFSSISFVSRRATGIKARGTAVTIAPFVHFFGLHTTLSLLLAMSQAGRERSFAVLLAVGLNAALLMTKIRLTASTRTPWPLVQLDVLPFYGAVLAHGVLGWPLEAGAFASLLIWQMIALVMLWYDTITRICAALGIPFLAELHLDDVPGRKRQ
eukprot:NODE_9980_length_1385_cov_5.709062.p1 GENE.NODE_9980_length_1385_cov_5.709062~~NODE_9980_length_1385_cov_5.709062.p1  ORF type:complete len:373 (+),score=72.01 NODE_9980_length_1385_cov_5.709062:71-1189(+)